MTEELKVLQKDARRKKRIATEMASEVHDLVEDRLWTDYNSLVDIAEKTRQACLAWAEAQQKLESAESEIA